MWKKPAYAKEPDFLDATKVKKDLEKMLILYFKKHPDCTARMIES